MRRPLCDLFTVELNGQMFKVNTVIPQITDHFKKYFSFILLHIL